MNVEFRRINIKGSFRTENFFPEAVQAVNVINRITRIVGQGNGSCCHLMAVQGQIASGRIQGCKQNI
ncbi:hypothetical protein D3C75_1044540 [compost metagenome]